MTDLATFKIKLKDLVSSQLDKVSRRFGIASKAADDFEGKANKGIGRTNKKLSALNNLGRLAGARNGMAAFSSSSRFAAAGLNPIIAGIGLATVGAVKLGIALVDSGTKLQNNLQITNQLLGGSAKETKNLTAQATALSKVYGDDYTSTVQAASKLATKFGIDNASAFDLLKKGYASGANIGGDMLKTLEDSADAFKGLGATADQQMAILQQSVSKGIKDAPKLLESFNKNLPNLGGDVGRLLDQNFGEGFANSLKKNIKNGEATAIHALKAISTAVGQTKLGQGAAESLAEQIFGDSSGNAVQLLSNFSAFNTNLDALVAKNGQFNQSKLTQLQLEKQIASTQLKSSKTLENIGSKFKVFGLQMKATLLGGLNGFLKMAAGAWRFGGAIVNLVSGISNALGVTRLLSGAFGIAKKILGGLTSVVGSFFSWFTDKINALASFIGGGIDTKTSNKSIDTNSNKSANNNNGLNNSSRFVHPMLSVGKNETNKNVLLPALNSIDKSLKTSQKTAIEERIFNVNQTTEKPSLSNKAETQLNKGINSITTGGSQVRNLSINFKSMIDKLEIHSTVAEASEEIQDTLKEMFVKVLQGGETTLNRG